MSTFRSYPTVEVALSVFGRAADSGGEHKAEGDIIECRHDIPDVIGTKERNDYLWLLLDGLEIRSFHRLRDQVAEPRDDTGVHNEHVASYVVFDKRRYCIPLERLKAVVPSLDLTRVRDRNDGYQPFMVLDEDRGRVLTREQPLSAIGLVYDKILTQYINGA